jgi:hypothetical protein
MSDSAHYFRNYGTCRCGKPATGEVLNNRNALMERTCQVCGERRVRLARREQLAEAKRKIGT